MCERVQVMYAGTVIETGSALTDLRLASAPVYARPAPERAAPRYGPPPGTAADRGGASEHAHRAGELPVRAPLPVRTGGLPRELAAPARPGSTTASRLFPPRTARRVGPKPPRGALRERHRAAARRDARTFGSGFRSRAGSCSTVTSATSRPSTASTSPSGEARRSGSWASRDAVSRRSGGRSSVSTSRPRGKCSSTSATSRASRKGRCALFAGGCR